MLVFDPRFLGAVSTQGILNISRAQDTVAWSRDNQVALITDGGGVFIVDFVQNHETLGTEPARFVGNETKIPCNRSTISDLENYTGISLSRVLQSKNKNEIFEIVRDPVMSPKEMSNAEVHLYFTKVEWSANALKINQGTYGKSQHVLGVLDSHFRLQLFIKKLDDSSNQEGVTVEDDWEVCVDFTNSYRNMLVSQFWSINVEDEDAFSSSIFSEYKRRMYELATVDFIWLPPWDELSSFENELESTFITAHASGDVCIWKLCLDPLSRETKPMFFLTLEFRRNLIPHEIVSSMCFHKLSRSLGLLLIGTTVGSVRAFKIGYDSVISRSLKPLPEGDDPPPQKYVFDDGVILCEKDLIEIQSISCDSHNSSSINIFVFKHPNVLLPFKLEVSQTNEIVIQEIYKATRIVQGILAGIVILPKNHLAPDQENTTLLAITQRGNLKWMNIENGCCQNESSIDLSAMEDQGTTSSSDQGPEKLKKRFQFGGLAVSPNSAMVCVSKTLAEYFDHLVLRTPSVLQFHSLFPTKQVWPLVYKKYISNQFQLQLMIDVLASFKTLMTLSDQYLKEVLDWAVPLSNKSINELQILLWILRVQPRVNQDQLVLAFNLRKEELRPFLNLKYQSIRTCRRETLVSDRIMQLRCLNLIEKVIANPETYDLSVNQQNLQSLMVMYEYLETKKTLIQEKGPLPLKPRVLVDPPPRRPACTLCGKTTKMVSIQNTERWVRNEDFTVEHEIDEEEIDGVLWHEQEHLQKSRSHPITNCILSMIPTSFPYRKCKFCGTICMVNPSFNQEPICPLCNGVMLSADDHLNQDEINVIGEDELKEIIKKLQNEQKSNMEKQKNDPKTSRKARIEKMFVDS